MNDDDLCSCVIFKTKFFSRVDCRLEVQQLKIRRKKWEQKKKFISVVVVIFSLISFMFCCYKKKNSWEQATIRCHFRMMNFQKSHAEYLLVYVNKTADSDFEIFLHFLYTILILYLIQTNSKPPTHWE
jgi:hypothetical protein